METIRTTLFEDPLSVYVGCAVAELVLLALWHETRTRRRAMLLLVPLVVAAAAVALERCVVTDREQIIQAVEQIGADIGRGRLDAAELYLDEQFGGHWQSKPAALAAGRLAIRTWSIRKVVLQNVDVEVLDGRARMHAVTWVTFAAAGAEQKTSLVWDVLWVRRPAGWRVSRVESVDRKIEF